jgi:hypothetical protein
MEKIQEGLAQLVAGHGFHLLQDSRPVALGHPVLRDISASLHTKAAAQKGVV